jgi:hypothetical protein
MNAGVGFWLVSSSNTHHLLCFAAPAHPDGLADTDVFVAHLQELESADIGRGVELEVHAPHLVRVLGLVTPHRAVSHACHLVLSRGGPLQALLALDAVHPFVVTVQHSRRIRRCAIRTAQRICLAAISRRRRRSFSSSIETTLAGCRWVLRCLPTKRQTLRCDPR